MPKLPPFALANAAPRARTARYLLAFFFLFAIPLFALHAQLLSLPFFWDEHGQFVPTALDILRRGAWVAKSTVPNVHPPGVEAVLALFYRLFGYSIPITRVVMLLWASAGVLVLFLLSIELSKGTRGAPAFLPAVLLIASPLFFMQSMMAQLDMPAMVLTLLALLLFVKGRYEWAAAACVALVLVKETGLAVPFTLFCWCVWQKQWRRAAIFVASPIALGAWLLLLHHKTGYWLGDPGFAHYNVSYALEPVRMLLCFGRHIYYLFFAEMRVAGTVVLLLALRRCPAFRTPAWAVVTLASIVTFLLVTALGGAELERYLLPILPVFYIAVAVALTTVPKPVSISVTAVMLAGLAVSLFWNPPYPFPFEDNYSMVDFVRLQQAAGHYAEENLKGKTIATAWPYTASLRNPDFGMVHKSLKVVETGDFHLKSIQAANPARFDALITYTRTWEPENGVLQIGVVRKLLSHYYQWRPDITPDECEQLGLTEAFDESLGGQNITVYVRQ